jgi:hypothetical protein
MKVREEERGMLTGCTPQPVACVTFATATAAEADVSVCSPPALL